MDAASAINRAHFDGYWTPAVRLKSYLQYNAVFTRQLIEEGLRQTLPNRDHKRVLDVGFGLGEHLFLFPKTATLRGTELSQKAITLVGAEAKRRGYADVELRMPSSADGLDYEGDQFDVVICSHVIEHLQDDRAMLATVYRVLRPGGLAVIQIPLDLFDSEIHPDAELINPDFLAGKSDHVHRYNVASFDALLQEAGFKIVYQYCGGKPMDILMAIEVHFRSRLRRLFPPLDRCVSALLNVPLALLPFGAKRFLDQVLGRFGVRDRYGLWVVAKER